MTITGECFCGAIGYEICGPLKDPRACHCSRCRKAFSGQSSNYARVAAAEFRWTRGEELLTSYASEQGFGILFCSVCGSTMCGTFGDAVHGVTLGCLNEDPEIDDIDHIFVDSKAAWDVIPERVRQFSEDRGKTDGRS